MDFKYEQERIYLKDEDGKTVAEVTFPPVSNDEVNINHTFVDKSLRGQGMADKLITALAKDLKKNNKKAYATCWYAAEWFENHPEYSDIYINKKK